MVAKGGKNIQVEFVSNVYLVDGRNIIQCNIRDVSVRAKVQEASRTHLSALEVANKAKDEFLAALSHELRTPLSAISSMLDVLELQHNLGTMLDVKTPADLDDSGLALIRRNIRVLVNLINELLDLTHISRGNLHLELTTIDAHQAMMCFATWRLSSKQNDLICGSTSGRSFAISKSTQQNFTGSPNLIGNAIKFTPIEGMIRVTTSNASNDNLVIEISDSGIGIDAGSLSRIFAP